MPYTVERGQIWQLGRHRLMCGDATSREDVETLLDGNKATLCFTDPPYGAKKEKEGVLNDNLNQKKLAEFNARWIPLSLDALTDIGSWYCWGADSSLLDIYATVLRPMMLKDKGLSLRNLIACVFTDDMHMWRKFKWCKGEKALICAHTPSRLNFAYSS